MLHFAFKPEVESLTGGLSLRTGDQLICFFVQLVRSNPASLAESYLCLLRFFTGLMYCVTMGWPACMLTGTSEQWYGVLIRMNGMCAYWNQDIIHVYVTGSLSYGGIFLQCTLTNWCTYGAPEDYSASHPHMHTLFGLVTLRCKYSLQGITAVCIQVRSHDAGHRCLLLFSPCSQCEGHRLWVVNVW